MQDRKCIYPKVEELMNAKGISYSYIAFKIGEDIHTVIRKLRGDRGMKLWEAIAMKRALKSDLPLEELFQEGRGLAQ